MTTPTAFCSPLTLWQPFVTTANHHAFNYLPLWVNNTVVHSAERPNGAATGLILDDFALAAMDTPDAAAHELAIEGDTYRTRQRPQHP